MPSVPDAQQVPSCVESTWTKEPVSNSCHVWPPSVLTSLPVSPTASAVSPSQAEPTRKPAGASGPTRVHVWPPSTVRAAASTAVPNGFLLSPPTASPTLESRNASEKMPLSWPPWTGVVATDQVVPPSCEWKTRAACSLPVPNQVSWPRLTMAVPEAPKRVGEGDDGVERVMVGVLEGQRPARSAVLGAVDPRVCAHREDHGIVAVERLDIPEWQARGAGRRDVLPGLAAVDGTQHSAL